MKLTPEQNLLVDKAIRNEKEVVKVVRDRKPFVEIYMQHLKTDPTIGQIQSSDEHSLNRYGDSNSTPLRKSVNLKEKQSSIAKTLFPDADGLDRKHYAFHFVHREFLGNVETSVFEVTPLSRTDTKHLFIGRVWVEHRNGFIVRFNGSPSLFENAGHHSIEQHFDAWRTNTEDALWLPTSSYAEMQSQGELTLKATTQVWGYRLKSLRALNQDAELAVLAIDGANDESETTTDVGPLEAQRAWAKAAEDDVVERLYQAGLLDAPSDFDKTLEALANNILAYNNIEVVHPIRVRTMITQPLESFAVGNTVVLSKGLINTTGILTDGGVQQTADLNALLAFQIAHILQHHRMDLRYAFNDRLLFSPTNEISHISMRHTDAENEIAAQKAIELLNVKELRDSKLYFGLYLRQLSQRVDSLKALTMPLLGDGLMRTEGVKKFWMEELIDTSPQTKTTLRLVGAAPVSNFIRPDPSTDEVVVANTQLAMLSSPDPAPFEIQETYLPLKYGAAIPVKVTSGGLDNSTHQVVKIFFATDRESHNTSADAVTFLGNRARNDTLSLGTAEVSVPRDHRMGELERPSLLRLEFREDPSRHVTMLQAETLDSVAFNSELSVKLRSDPEKQALIFVHGYNVTFEEATRRLGQMVYDLGFAGVPILYSWPSKGNMLGYGADEASAEWSSPHFLQFLGTLQSNEEIKTIYVIGHSMGNRLIASALSTSGQSSEKSKIREVIMAAPDIDAGVFQHIADSMRRSAAHITIYESSKDLALEMSHHFHDFSRLGDTDPTVHVFTNYECIEATAVSTGLLGHSYVGDSGSILSDIFEILQHGSHASERFRLSSRKLGGLTYWSFNP